MRRYVALGMLIIVGFVATYVGTQFFRPKKSDRAQNMRQTNIPEVADMTIEDMHLIEQTQDGDSWRLFAHNASFYDARQLILMHSVKAQLLSNTQQAVYIEASAGQLDSATGNMSVRGGVQLQYLQEYTIEAEVLHWHASRRVLQTDTAVRIVGHSVRIAGTGLYGDPEQQYFTLRDQVHASFQFH